MDYGSENMMLYGAYGYSGKLIVEELTSRGIRPVLAGRNAGALEELSRQYNCIYRVFDTEESENTDRSLNDIGTLLNCAGPFKYTAKNLMEGCLRSSANYIDITGEMPVMHLAFSLNKQAVESGIVLLPGAGFDIIPTDCLAKRLSEALPEADSLKLGILNKKGKISRGTWLTTLDFLGGMGRVRKNGQVVDSKIGEYTVRVNRAGFSFSGISIPWGDVYSSYHSTGIPDSEVYLGLPEIIVKLKVFVIPALALFKLPLIQKLVHRYISRNITGPSKIERDEGETYIWGKVEKKNGEMREEAYRVMEGYNLTAKGAAECAERIMKNRVTPGYHTPSTAFGSGFMDQFVIDKLF